METGFDLAGLQNIALQNPSINWYALTDSAQDCALHKSLLRPERQVRCLFDYSQESPIAEYAPHLVALGAPKVSCRIWRRLVSRAKSSSCVSILASRMSFDNLYHQLYGCIDVLLPDGDSLFLAFWDPAILGTLLGQKDDATLHVKGPVLTASQKTMLLHGLRDWWYWDRNGIAHTVDLNLENGTQVAKRIVLCQRQVDALVEASVPDHVLYYLEKNHPELIQDTPSKLRYEIVRLGLVRARAIGLVSMKDLLNYLCIEFFYKDAVWKDQAIASSLKSVKDKRVELSDAIRSFPY
jgi:hypothetical protein